MPVRDLMAHDIYVWRVDVTHPDAHPDNLIDLLSDHERRRSLEYKFPRDGKRFIVVRAALRHILATFLGTEPRYLEFSTGSRGKPHLTNQDLQFNVSHSGAVALIALAHDRKLGVDIEEMRQIDDAVSIARRFFAPEEAHRLGAMTDSATIMRAFFECWTRKEAFIKATGEGLSRPLNEFHVSFFPNEIAELRIDCEDPGRWILADVNPGHGYCAALVYEQPADSPTPRIIEREWQPPR